MQSFVLLVANRPSLEHCKVPIYYDYDSLKLSFLLSTLPIMIQFTGKSANLMQKSKFYLGKVQSFPKSKFGINQVCKILLTQTHQIWNFNPTGWLYNVLRDFIEM